LVAMPRMGDARFEKSVIYICAHSEEGSMGFIINKPIEKTTSADFLTQLNIISEDEDHKLSPILSERFVHSGGPVEPGRGFVLHTPEYEGDSTIKVSKDVYLTATLEILREIAVGRGPKKYMLALGYSGWSAGQLVDEISSNGWLVTEANLDAIYGEDHDAKYDFVLKEMGIDPRLLSSDTGHA
ncbi:MAG: YqgE/AlgH family protein, partial [Nitratireductor sp.]